MNKVNIRKPKVLIVDDSEMNRAILSEMLGGDYDIIEADNGAKAIAILQRESVSISLVLLDVVMPVMDGYEVLSVMNSKHWIDDVPVIMISADNSTASRERAYELGVTEFIRRPFDALTVRRRAVNTIMLYAKQRKLAVMVANQIYEKERSSSLMISILSHIVEFRNGESGMHVLNVQLFTHILLKQLVQTTDKYNLTVMDISLISKASALHDIGKISVPDGILNKPGKLTNEEFAIMKTHSMAGAEMLDELLLYKDEPLVQVAYEICRWHHERYDGKGYPDGLVEDDIPISAQIVALADVYDALTSKRVYKDAYSHEKAMNMIMNGECGTFNPILIQCLTEAYESIKVELNANSSHHGDKKNMEGVMSDIMQNNELSASEEIISLLEHEKVKNQFYSSLAKNILFEYTVEPYMMTLSPLGVEKLGLEETIMNPLKNERILSIISEEDVKKLSDALRNTTPKKPVVQYDCNLKINNELHSVKIVSRSTWYMGAKTKYTGAIGEIFFKDEL